MTSAQTPHRSSPIKANTAAILTKKKGSTAAAPDFLNHARGYQGAAELPVCELPDAAAGRDADEARVSAGLAVGAAVDAADDDDDVDDGAEDEFEDDAGDEVPDDAAADDAEGAVAEAAGAALAGLSFASRAFTMVQPPSSSAPSSIVRRGVWILPTTRAVRPSSIFSLAMMSPLTVPFTVATATLMFASTWPFVPMISVPESDMIVPIKCPSTRSIAWKFVSPLSVVPWPTNPLSRPSLMSRAIFSLSVTGRLAAAVSTG